MDLSPKQIYKNEKSIHPHVFTADLFGHLGSIAGVAAGIIFPGQNETFTTIVPNYTSVFWHLRDFSYSQMTNLPNTSASIATSRKLILPPGSHEVRLVYGGINNGPNAINQLDAGTLTGFVMPIR